MLSARSWEVAQRYVVPPLVLGLILTPIHRRLAALVLAAAGAVLVFFRDPDRPLDADTAVLYAAADGVVTHVGTVRAPWLPSSDAVCVSTFLSLHNVHVTRSPVSGEVVEQVELEGGVRPALLPGAAANRQARISIDGPGGRVGVVLIAGAIARRISSWVTVGDRLSAGARLGLIHFGSRVDVVLSGETVDVLVKRGDRVVGARTPIARLKATEDR